MFLISLIYSTRYLFYFISPNWLLLALLFCDFFRFSWHSTTGQQSTQMWRGEICYWKPVALRWWAEGDREFRPFFLVDLKWVAEIGKRRTWLGYEVHAYPHAHTHMSNFRPVCYALWNCSTPPCSLRMEWQRRFLVFSCISFNSDPSDLNGVT